MGQKVPWEKSQSNISYRYLGIDSQNNLHLERVQVDFDSTNVKANSSRDICKLIFALDANRTADITLIGQRSRNDLIKIHIEASNNGTITKYLGSLPVYKE
jgi:hypothetical protein